MKNYLKLFLLLFLVGCSISPFNKRSKSVSVSYVQTESQIRENSTKPALKGAISDPNEDILSEKICENNLIDAVNKYIKQNKLEDSTHTYQKESGQILIRPIIAITNPELLRLKAAWSTSGAEHDVLAKRFARADEAIDAILTFPPEGGQHNQWYQCDSCQRGLRTIDAHNHQCPSCKKIFSGFPYDNVLYNRQHSSNISRAEDAAWAWAITGKKKYSDFAASVLEGYAQRYLNYPMISASVNDKSIDIAAGKHGKYRSAGHINSQTLDEAMLLIPLATAYDLIYNTLSDIQKQNIEDKLIRAMANCINVYKSGKSNWQTWHNGALLYAGAVLGDGNLLRQALLDEKNGFIAQMNISVMPEGMWYENSWGYHYYTLSAMTHIAEGARRLGIDIYNFPPLRKMYFIAFDYMMSDGSLPRFGDAVQDSPFHQGVNEKAFAIYKDDRLLSNLPSEVNWDAIVLGRDMSAKGQYLKSASKLIPGAGHAILATDGPGKLTAALTFGPFGGFHGHYDKLSFVLFGYGEEFGVDPGRSASQAYRLPIHREWYKPSTGHNIVLADGKSQKEADGKYLAFNSTDSYAAVTASAGPAFENVTHNRFLLLSPTYLIVIDELKSTDGVEHTFDWIYHNKGQFVTCNMSETNLKLENTPAGYAYLKDINAYKNKKEQYIRAKFTGEKTTLYMIMAGEKGDEIFTGNGPLKSIDDRVPVIIVRRKGKSVRFITVLEPVLSGSKNGVKNINVTRDALFGTTVIHKDGTDHISFTGDNLEKFIVSRETGSGSKILLKY